MKISKPYICLPLFSHLNGMAYKKELVRVITKILNIKNNFDSQPNILLLLSFELPIHVIVVADCDRD